LAPRRSPDRQWGCCFRRTIISGEAFRNIDIWINAKNNAAAGLKEAEADMQRFAAKSKAVSAQAAQGPAGGQVQGNLGRFAGTAVAAMAVVKGIELAGHIGSIVRAAQAAQESTGGAAGKSRRSFTNNRPTPNAVNLRATALPT
jgi:hypothetical protein